MTARALVPQAPTAHWTLQPCQAKIRRMLGNKAHWPKTATETLNPPESAKPQNPKSSKHLPPIEYCWTKKILRNETSVNQDGALPAVTYSLWIVAEVWVWGSKSALNGPEIVQYLVIDTPSKISLYSFGKPQLHIILTDTEAIDGLGTAPPTNCLQ